VRMPAMAHRMRVCARLGVCVCTSARVGVTRRGHTQCACVRSRTDMEAIDAVRLSLCSEHARAGAKLPLDGCSLPPCSAPSRLAHLSHRSRPSLQPSRTVASRSLPSSPSVLTRIGGVRCALRASHALAGCKVHSSWQSRSAA
jgi:hypothetical protein